jgi:FkbM family methyltransferase
MYKINYKGVKIEIPNEILKYSINMPINERLEKGIYEKEELYLTSICVDENSKVLELGSSLGVLSCVINNMMTNKKDMVVVEANPKLIGVIENNRDINSLEFTIINNCISYEEKEINFYYNGISLSGSLIERDIWVKNENKYGEYKKIKYKSITPELIEKEYNINFNTLVCDIEGYEYKLLKELYSYFINYKYMIVEFHDIPGENRDKIQKQITNLYSKEFNISNIGSTLFFKNKKIL